MEFLESGFEENGIETPRSAYLYVATVFQRRNIPVPFEIPRISEHKTRNRPRSVEQQQRLRQVLLLTYIGHSSR